jgi:Sec-independent protein translocase protein TatA
MNENQTPQINNEQQNKGQQIPSWVGIVLILVLVGTFVFFFWKFQQTGSSVKQAIESQKAASEETANQIVSQENPATGNTAPSTAANETIPAPASAAASQSSGSTVDINYEVKKMDDSANSVDENDFDSNNYSNAQIGL